MENTRRKWQDFTFRHRETFRKLEEEIPSFWAEVEDLAHSHKEETNTTRGAVIKEFPTTREAGTQTEGNHEPPARERGDMRSQGGQTPFLDLSLAALEAAADRRQISEPQPTRSTPSGSQRIPVHGAESRRPRTRATYTSPGRRAFGCWNCGENNHKYTECPERRRVEFCYRCGQEGTTLKDCPQCRTEWQEEGPYRPGTSIPRDPKRRGEGRR